MGSQKSLLPRLALAASLVLTLTWACDNDATAPETPEPLLYRLWSVNGQALPLYVVPPGAASTVYRSDLLLHGDGTFQLGVEGVPGFLASGTYTETAGRLTFTVSNGQYEWPPLPYGGVLSGDSLVMSGPSTFVYRRAPVPPPLLRGEIFRLHLINGRGGEPLTLIDTMFPDERFVRRILYDSLFFDGYFYRQHRYERQTSYRVVFGDSISTTSEDLHYGWYEVDGNVVVLRRLTVFSFSSTYDTLTLTGAELVRRTNIDPVFIEERYRRLP